MKIFIALILAALCAFQSGAAQAKPRLLAAPQTRDTWRSVRTNNMFVIGNADPEKLRQVAAWLEFFHRSFARLISRNLIDSSVPTTVIVFRDEASFRPFKPIYQGRAANVAGFFLPGNDVNYIAFSVDSGERDSLSTAFHEYVHLHLKDNIPGAPLWLNEGLAELYGSLQFSGSDALLGAPIHSYIQLLRGEGLLPLKTLFSIGTDSPHYNEDDKTGIFYGQSWALVHYLMLGDSGRQENFRQFLQQVSRGEDSAKAIERSFGVSVATLEEELSSYVRRGNLTAQRIATIDPQAYASYTAMQRSALSEGEANYYLGDLLQHSGRENDAERYLRQAIALDPGFTPSYASLGVLYVQQRRYAEAKKYLQKATSSPQSSLVHYLHAYVLSRENISADGRISGYSAESAAMMREQLLRSIKLDPNYAPAPHLLALVDLVRNERLDEAVEMAQKARQLAPGKSGYSLLLAQIYLQRSEPALARQILEQLTHDSDQSVKAEAQDLLQSLNENRSGARPTRSSPPAVNTSIAEPVTTGKSRMLGGESSSAVVNDGQTILASGPLPALDEVLSKYVEAMGGIASIDKMTSRVIKGTVNVVGVSRGGSFETHAQAPNKIATMLQAYPVGTVNTGFNGRTGWARTAKGLLTLKGLELAAVQRDADFYGQFRPKSLYPKITLAGMSKIGYREVYVLDLVPASGQAERLFLDAKTYLPVRNNTVLMLGGNKTPVEIYLDDWRDVDGVKYPFYMSQRFPGMTLTYTVNEIKHNVQIDPKVFEP
jgi:Flp pilus assembly protein TadD